MRLSALESDIYEVTVTPIGTFVDRRRIAARPLKGCAEASFGLDVAFGIIDRLLGGKGKSTLNP